MNSGGKCWFQDFKSLRNFEPSLSLISNQFQISTHCLIKNYSNPVPAHFKSLKNCKTPNFLHSPLRLLLVFSMSGTTVFTTTLRFLSVSLSSEMQFLMLETTADSWNSSSSSSDFGCWCTTIGVERTVGMDDIVDVFLAELIASSPCRSAMKSSLYTSRCSQMLNILEIFSLTLSSRTSVVAFCNVVPQLSTNS